MAKKVKLLGFMVLTFKDFVVNHFRKASVNWNQFLIMKLFGFWVLNF